MIQMLRKEACSGSIDDLAHVRTEMCLSDCLTKHSAKPDNLILAIQTGVLPEVDKHPPFRSLIQHRAYLAQWVSANLRNPAQVGSFLDEPVSHALFLSRASGEVPARDYWKRQGNQLIRVHVQPRKSLFVPGQGCPIPTNNLMVCRETLLVRGTSQPFVHVDQWNTSDSARTLKHSWIGETRFVVS